MRLTISSTTLASRLTALSKVFNSKNSLPILDCYLFEVNDNQLTITASDSENVMTTQIQLDESDGNGTFAVNNRNILDAVKELPEQPLTLDVDMSTYAIKVIYMNGMYNFTAQSGDEFPRMQPLNDSAAAITIESKTLANDIAHSIFATANEELRPVMNGIYFDLKEDSLAIVASDGHKLVCSTLNKVGSSNHSSLILPKKPAMILRNVLGRDTNEVEIAYTARNAEIRTPDFTINCRLTEGRYPNYSIVIPQDNTNCAVINRNALISALRRVLVFATKTSLTKLTFSEHGLQISSQDIELSKSAEERVFCDYSGVPMSIGFKGAFLLELINIIEGEELVIKLSDASRAGIITPAEDTEDESVLMLLMPMMLNE